MGRAVLKAKIFALIELQHQELAYTCNYVTGGDSDTSSGPGSSWDMASEVNPDSGAILQGEYCLLSGLPLHHPATLDLYFLLNQKDHRV